MYATFQDIIDTFGIQEVIELTNLDDSSLTTVNEVQLQKAIDHATGLINSYLQSRYSLPLVETPAVLTRLCCDIARYWLDKYRERQDVRQRYEDALNFLKDLAKGLVSLANNDSPLNAGSPQYFSEERVFTRNLLSDYVL